MKKILSILLATGMAFSIHAQSKSDRDKKWDVTEKHANLTTAEFETNEGTWISLDVSPDGKTIVFDMMGDIYTMPVSGGSATNIADGPAFEFHPRFSPDGKKIAFTSDREGCENIWIMNVDGSNKKSITKEKERQLNNPVWTKDGQYIIGRKHYRNTRSVGAGEMWMYHVGGGSDGLKITKRRDWQHSAGEPELSPDGKFLYYSEDIRPGQTWEYNADPNGTVYVIKRINLETGEIENIATGAGGSVRPQLSPDGKTLAFVRRIRLKSVLMTQDLTTGKETEIYDELSRDAQETWAIHGVYPNFDWMPNGKDIIIYAKGKILSINIDSKKATNIPFKATVKQQITDAVNFPQVVSPDEFDVKMLQFVTVSPDKKSVIYQALGKIYIRALPDGKPTRLTNDEENMESMPSYSADGKWIVYASWNDENFGAIHKIQTNGKSKTKLTTEKGHYAEPVFSNNGKWIAYRKIGSDGFRSNLFTKESGLYLMTSDGEKPNKIFNGGFRPFFNSKNDRIYLNSYESGQVALISIDLTGNEKRVHFTSENMQDIIPSPDEKWIAFQERYNAYIAPFPKTGQTIAISPSSNNYPVRRITRDAGYYLNFSSDSKTLYWSLGPELFSRDLTNAFKFVEGAKDSIQEKPDTAGLYISFKQKTYQPDGLIAITNATIITMKGDEVIQNGTVLIEKNKIKSIGKSSDLTIPKEAKVIDAKGKFVMPGMVDVHAHLGYGGDGFTPQQNWQMFTNLSFGVTTTHNPSTDTESMFAAAELQKSGKIVSPRLYSTGTILYGAEGSYKAIVNSYEDAVSHLRRLKAVGAFSVKSYNQPRRDQRQQIIEAARSLNMMVYPEGGSDWFANMTMILDGHTGIEHTIPVSPLYKDVLGVFGKGKTAYTPTLIVSYGGNWGENYWYATTKVWENSRLMTFTPREIVDSRSRRRMLLNDDDWNHIDNAKAVKQAHDAGVKIQLGAHGQLQGLGAHWELWMFVQGGMSNHEALRAATLSGAEYIGMDKEIGSLETGKLADLLVLDKNPLSDIKNSETISYVMVNGRLFDARTMNEVGNQNLTRKPFYFEGRSYQGMSIQEMNNFGFFGDND